MTNYLKNKVLDDNLQGVYIGLISNGNEVSKKSYARQPLEFREAVEGQTANTQDALFPVALEDWGRITEVALYNAEELGEELFRSVPEVIKTIEASSQYKIPKDYLIVRLR